MLPRISKKERSSTAMAARIAVATATQAPTSLTPEPQRFCSTVDACTRLKAASCISNSFATSEATLKAILLRRRNADKSFLQFVYRFIKSEDNVLDLSHGEALQAAKEDFVFAMGLLSQHPTLKTIDVSNGCTDEQAVALLALSQQNSNIEEIFLRNTNVSEDLLMAIVEQVMHNQELCSKRAKRAKRKLKKEMKIVNKEEIIEVTAGTVAEESTDRQNIEKEELVARRKLMAASQMARVGAQQAIKRRALHDHHLVERAQFTEAEEIERQGLTFSYLARLLTLFQQYETITRKHRQNIEAAAADVIKAKIHESKAAVLQIEVERKKKRRAEWAEMRKLETEARKLVVTEELSFRLTMEADERDLKEFTMEIVQHRLEREALEARRKKAEKDRAEKERFVRRERERVEENRRQNDRVRERDRLQVRAANVMANVEKEESANALALRQLEAALRPYHAALGKANDAEKRMTDYCLSLHPSVVLQGKRRSYLFLDTIRQAHSYELRCTAQVIPSAENELRDLVDAARAARRHCHNEILAARRKIFIDSMSLFYLASEIGCTIDDLEPDYCPHPGRFIQSTCIIHKCVVRAEFQRSPSVTDYPFIKEYLHCSKQVDGWEVKVCENESILELHSGEFEEDVSAEALEPVVNAVVNSVNFGVQIDQEHLYTPFFVKPYSVDVTISVELTLRSVGDECVNSRGKLCSASPFTTTSNSVSSFVVTVDVFPPLLQIRSPEPIVYSRSDEICWVTPLVDVVTAGIPQHLEEEIFSNVEIEITLKNPRSCDKLLLRYEPGTIAFSESTTVLAECPIDTHGAPVWFPLAARFFDAFNADPVNSQLSLSLCNKASNPLHIQRFLRKCIAFQTVGPIEKTTGTITVEVCLADGNGVRCRLFSSVSVVEARIKPGEQLRLRLPLRSRPFFSACSSSISYLNSIHISYGATSAQLFRDSQFYFIDGQRYDVSSHCFRGNIEVAVCTNWHKTDILKIDCSQTSCLTTDRAGKILFLGNEFAVERADSSLKINFETEVALSYVEEVIQAICFTCAEKAPIPEKGQTIEKEISIHIVDESTGGICCTEKIKVCIEPPLLALPNCQSMQILEGASVTSFGPFEFHQSFSDKYIDSMNSGVLRAIIVQGSGDEDLLVLKRGDDWPFEMKMVDVSKVGRRRSTSMSFSHSHAVSPAESLTGYPTELMAAKSPLANNLLSPPVMSSNVPSTLKKKVPPKLAKVSNDTLFAALQIGSTSLLSILSNWRGSRYLMEAKAVLQVAVKPGDQPFDLPPPPRAAVSVVERCRNAIRDHVRQETVEFGALRRNLHQLAFMGNMERVYEIVRKGTDQVIARASMTRTSITFRFADAVFGEPPVTFNEAKQLIASIGYVCEPCPKLTATQKFLKFSLQGWDGSASQAVCVVGVVKTDNFPLLRMVHHRLRYEPGQFQLSVIGSFPVAPYSQVIAYDLSTSSWFDGGFVSVEIVGGECQGDCLTLMSRDEQLKARHLYDLWRQEQLLLTEQDEPVCPLVVEILSKFQPYESLAEMLPTKVLLKTTPTTKGLPKSKGEEERAAIGQVFFDLRTNFVKCVFVKGDPPRCDGAVVCTVLNAVAFKAGPQPGRRVLEVKLQKEGEGMPQAINRMFIDVFAPKICFLPSSFSAKKQVNSPEEPVFFMAEAVVDLGSIGSVKDGYAEMRLVGDALEQYESLFFCSDRLQQKGCELFLEEDYIGKVVVSHPLCVKLDFDWATQGSEENILHLFQSMAYKIQTLPKEKAQRQIEVTFSIGTEKSSPSATLLTVTLALDAAPKTY